jgi:aspartyl-tRNA(Asn)/glutamyl-tRNA(Gln) amidotransferase subunit C
MIEKKDIENLAKLSRMELSDKEASSLTKDIESILGYVDQLKEVSVDLKDKKSGENRNVLREDENPHESEEFTRDILKESPNTEDGYIKVKNIL